MARRPTALNIDLNQKPEDMSISKFLLHLSMMDDSSEKVKKINDFALCLEDEYKRLVASQQHFPNCMQFLRDAMEMCQNEKLMCMIRVGMKEHTPCERRARARNMSIINDESHNWLSSARLWTTLHFFNNRQLINPEYDVEGQYGILGNNPVCENMTSMIMNLDPVRPRKKRRNWDSNLHMKFMSVVEALGGLREAKPKNIQRMMQVDDLTTEEIKSHLQRIREVVGSRAHHYSTPSSTKDAHP